VYILSQNLAKDLVSELSQENIVIAIWWKRAVAFVLDAIFILGILVVFTRGAITYAWEFMILVENPSETFVWFIINWCLIFGTFWLYFKYSCKTMQRSLGQRFMKLAIIFGDQTAVPQENWGKRALYKLRYVLPIVGQILGVIDLLKIMNGETHQSRIDWYNNTIVVMDWSLPTELRSILR
tara:strand:+ start:2729 stop:3271 length:543 start_codon:yes stop_codon:yes gene_type:complete